MNDSAAFIQTITFDDIFQKHDDWYKDMMHYYNKIGTAKKELDQAKIGSEEEYATKWDAWNQAYHWWLIRMDHYLCGFNDPIHNQLHEINAACFSIGHRTGYWNNKYSRMLYDWFQRFTGDGDVHV